MNHSQPVETVAQRAVRSHSQLTNDADGTHT